MYKNQLETFPFASWLLVVQTQSVLPPSELLQEASLQLLR